MRPLIAVAVLCAALLPPATSYAGAPAPAVSAKDAAKDVTIHRDVDGPSNAQRRSIDLLRFAAERRDHGVRFKVRIDRVLPKAGFDQVADLVLTPPPGSEVDWSGAEVWMWVQEPKASFAVLYLQGEEQPVWCDSVRTRFDARTDWVWVDVPSRCVPPGETMIMAQTLAGHRDEAPPWASDDVLQVPGAHVLLPE